MQQSLYNRLESNLACCKLCTDFISPETSELKLLVVSCDGNNSCHHVLVGRGRHRGELHSLGEPLQQLLLGILRWILHDVIQMGEQFSEYPPHCLQIVARVDEDGAHQGLKHVTENFRDLDILDLWRLDLVDQPQVVSGGGAAPAGLGPVLHVAGDHVLQLGALHQDEGVEAAVHQDTAHSSK